MLVCVALRFSRRPDPPVSVSIAPLSAFASDEGLLYVVPFAVKENVVPMSTFVSAIAAALYRFT